VFDSFRWQSRAGGCDSFLEKAFDMDAIARDKLISWLCEIFVTSKNVEKAKSFCSGSQWGVDINTVVAPCSSVIDVISIKGSE